MDMITSLTARLAAANLAELASRADVSRKTLERILSGTNSPTLRTVGKINRALDEMKVKAPRVVKVKSRPPEEIAESGRCGGRDNSLTGPI
ncbi:helix-turn-helix domain-containing protein [Roseateles terrae]|uniref:Transcriptional regulator n=1 Tax=Roseateles terrae TaxID=431060 RepID=A0ABR6GPC5_9BURK|nr:helix-turn-helix domain-containing protein [Roseateles terrae]MBB3193973.1 putative transcriptional regulator [Roseateles terrae]OWQ87848.1 hypothetical protein CDN98_06695 [Roseateles terrae]